MLVHNNGEYARHLGVLLNPGVNDLSAAEEAKFIKVYENPRFQHLFGEDEIEVIKEKEDGSASPFADLNADKAIELVRGTSDLALLEQFKSEEAANKNRKTVMESIDARVESLSIPAEETPDVEEQE
jgi:hypothetical protein